jgi:hypothetical protein
MIAPASHKDASSLVPIFTMISLVTSFAMLGYQISQASTVTELWGK